MTDTPSFDEIPVLTEVVADKAPVPAIVPGVPSSAADAVAEDAPPADAAADAPVAEELEAIPVLDALPERAAAEAAPAQSAALDDEAWRALEERLVTRVLDRLQPRIDVVLEDQVRDQMAVVLDHVAERLGVELRSALQQSIEHVVARAVQQELAHLIARQS
ncbi:hypothetical protein [Massilia aerilata]|uniref:DUF2486 family protein n=1 Tax=Massilia aerilata TaxID=453817 RepID=A0ABW0RSD6_9BURK